MQCCLAGIRVSVPRIAPQQQWMTNESLSRSSECGIENPHSFSSPCWRNSCGFFRFEMNAHKPFSICGYSFQNASGIPKGRQFLWLGVSNRGESTLLAVVSKGGSAALAGRIQRNRRFRGTRLFWKSLVCYTFGDRGWRKGVIRGGNKHFPSATEQAGSASSRTRSPGFCASRIRLFVCR